MQLDIRIPIGLLFGILGVILLVYGAVTHGSAMYYKSFDINVNLVWGAVLVFFSAVMLSLAWRAGRKRD
jgi:drug/metabolite transporter (DMT)-like permease